MHLGSRDIRPVGSAWAFSYSSVLPVMDLDGSHKYLRRGPGPGMDDCYKSSWYFEVVSEHPKAGTCSLSFLEWHWSLHFELIETTPGIGSGILPKEIQA